MWRLYLAAVVVIGIPIYFGLIDLGGGHADKAGNPAVAESTSCPGYKLIRRFQRDGVISDFKPVKPDPGWDCEYVVSDGVGDVQFRDRGNQIQVGFVAGGTTHTNAAANLEEAVTNEMDKLGFKDR